MSEAKLPAAVHDGLEVIRRLDLNWPDLRAISVTESGGDSGTLLVELFADAPLRPSTGEELERSLAHWRRYSDTPGDEDRRAIRAFLDQVDQQLIERTGRSLAVLFGVSASYAARGAVRALKNRGFPAPKGRK